MLNFKKIKSPLFILVLCLSFVYLAKSDDTNINRDDLMNCSAYHLKLKLYYQHSNEKKYKYHNEYFVALNELFLKKYPNISQTSFILSITSIMESWEYLAQEKGQSHASMKINRDYKDLCNSIINEN